jgi:Phage integrase, N-terminal SAM-like domain
MAPARRRKFDTFEEADLERARLALEFAQTGTIGGIKDNAMAALWPVYRADAVARLVKATIISYDRCWARHLEPRFGDMPMDEITPRSVAQWRADMLAKGIGRETARRAMVLFRRSSPATSRCSRSRRGRARRRGPYRPCPGQMRCRSPLPLASALRRIATAANAQGSRHLGRGRGSVLIAHGVSAPWAMPPAVAAARGAFSRLRPLGSDARFLGP